MVYLLCLGAELLGQRQHCSLEGCQCGMQTQNGADIGIALLVLTDYFLIISFTQECQCYTVAAQRRLDDIGNIVLVGLLIIVFQRLAGSLLMAAQIVVGTVGNAPQLAPAGAEGELVLDIGGSTGVESQLRGLMVTQTQRLFLDTKGDQPVLAVILPVGKPLQD